MEEASVTKAHNEHAHVEFEDQPHRAALEDNPDTVHINAGTWAAIFSLAVAFGPALGLGFVVITSVVLPVAQDLNGVDQIGWIAGSWSLATAVSFSLAGQMSDIFGRRNPILAGEALITVGSIVAGRAQNIGALIAGMTLTGFGTGFLFVAYAAVPEMLPNKWRSLGLGILEGGASIPWGVVYTLLGNALQKNASWRWIFYLSIITEVLAMIGTAFFYWPTPRPRGDFDRSRWQQVKELDWIGLTLFAGGLTSFLIGLTWGGTPAHPWRDVSTIAPIVVGFVVTTGSFVYDFTLAKNPTFPLALFKMFRQFSLLIIVLFISGMIFYSMAPLLPQGTSYMFTTDGIKVGIYALPNNIILAFLGTVVPLFAHRIGHIKWQLCAGILIQAAFMGATAAAVYPNKLHAWMWLPAIGVPIFIYITILAYAIASLHVPHSMLGVAVGLLGTFRSTGGAVGNSIFNTIFTNRFQAFVGEEVIPVALRNGFEPEQLPAIIAGSIAFNLGVPGSLEDIEGISPGIQVALREAVRNAYGHALKITFLSTLGFTIPALICALFVEDPSRYLTNHVQAAMEERRGHGHGDVEVAQVEK